MKVPMRFLCAILLLPGLAPIGGLLSVKAQQTVLYQDAERDFERLVTAYAQGFYGLCASAAEDFLSRYPEPAYARLCDEARRCGFQAGLRLKKPGIIGEIMAFAIQRQPHAIAQQALFLVADQDYADKRYEDAILHFGMIDERQLTASLRQERNFKIGYAHFAKKEFEEASAVLHLRRDVRDSYDYASNYYLGMARYLVGDYAGALQGFERAAVSAAYKDHIPYYITQIHFSTHAYKDVIGYGENALQNESVLHRSEIHQLVGRAYFETGCFAEAIPHLEIVEAGSATLSQDDFYQLGIAYYQTQKYREAISPFLAIRQEQGLKAQYANYYLADCYLQTGDRISARHAMQLAAARSDDPALATEAAFHYGRLSAEMGDDAEAIRVLQAIPASSTFYTAAQAALAGILVNTRDYTLAIRELEAMISLTPTLKTAYQRICLLRAEQLLQDEKADAAVVLFDKSLTWKEDPALEARAWFWKAEIAFQRGQLAACSASLDSYFQVLPRAGELPLAQCPPLAWYTRGYVALRQNDFPRAQEAFSRSLDGLKALREGEASMPLLREQVLPDLLLRAGDCAFKRNMYDVAAGYYDQSIRDRQTGFDYARYQTGLIRGLQKKPDEKIATMETLAMDMPDSRWADDALFAMGESYQDLGRSDQAIAAYQRIVDRYGRKSPLLHKALLRMGLIDFNNGHFEEALGHYKAVFSYDPDPETAREALAAIREIYVSSLDRPEAFFALTESMPGYAVSLSEKDFILYEAAESHYAEGNYAGAVTSFDRYINTNPDGAYSLKAKFLKAESLSLLRKYPEALAAFERVIEDGPGPYYAMALSKSALIAYHHQQAYDRALSHYKTYLTVAEDDQKAHEARVGVMRCAFRLGKRDDLMALLPAVLHYPGVTLDVQAAAHYYAGSMAWKVRDDDIALTEFNALISLNSGEWAAEARYAIAAIYARQEERAIAEKLAEEAARANVGYPVWVARSLLLVSDLRLAAGDLLNARAILEAILENFNDDPVVREEAGSKLTEVKAEEIRQRRIQPEAGGALELPVKPKKD